jgi:hypothetical protein
VEGQERAMEGVVRGGHTSVVAVKSEHVAADT